MEERNNLRLAAYAILVGFALVLILCGFVACGQMTALADEPKIIMNGEYVENDPQAGAIDIQAPPINRISEALDQADIDQYYYFDMGRISDPERQLEGVAIEKGWVYDETLPWSKEEQIKQFLGIRPKYEYLGEFRLTYYCPCSKCNGNNKAIDRMGNPLVWGTVAVDPKVIPLGTKLVIDGYDAVFTARDTGGNWVQGHHIDVYVPVSHKEALAMCVDENRKVWKVE